AWREARPRLIVIEGQGTLIHPAYPGGFEILGAARPEAVVLQHAPGRIDLEGFPGFPVADPSRHVEVIRLVSGAPAIGSPLARGRRDDAGLAAAARRIGGETGLPALDPLGDDGASLADLVTERLGLR